MSPAAAHQTGDPLLAVLERADPHQQASVLAATAMRQLADHEQECADRYAKLDRHVEQLHERVSVLRREVLAIVLSVAGTVLMLSLGVSGALLMRYAMQPPAVAPAAAAKP